MDGLKTMPHPQGSMVTRNIVSICRHTSKSGDADKPQPTIIPTSEIPRFTEWLEERGDDIGKAGVCFIASGSKVIISEDEIEACKVQF